MASFAPVLSTGRLLRISALTVGAVSLFLAGVALASAPLPQAAKAYSTGGIRGSVSVTLVTSASGKAIEPGAAALGSQFALSGGSVLCKKAKKGPGFHETPFAIFGFPGATLKLSHGKYGFSKSVTMPKTVPLGSSSSSKPFTLKVKIKGTVTSPTAITGTVKPKGGPCTSKKPLKFTAKLDPKIPVAPGQ